MTYRIDIPAELGGGWVEIKEKRSWADSNRLAGSALQLRQGLSATDITAAQEGGASDIFSIETHQAIAMELEVSIVAVAPELFGAASSVREWLASDDLDEDVGDFLLGEVRGYYASRRRSKSGTVEPEPGTGRGDSEGTAERIRAFPDREPLAGLTRSGA